MKFPDAPKNTSFNHMHMLGSSVIYWYLLKSKMEWRRGLYLQPVHCLECVCALKLDLTPGAPEKTFSVFSFYYLEEVNIFLSRKCRALFPSHVTGVIQVM